MLDLDPVLLGHPEAAARWRRRRRRAAGAAAAGGTHAGASELSAVSAEDHDWRWRRPGSGPARKGHKLFRGVSGREGNFGRSMLMPSLPTDRGLFSGIICTENMMRRMSIASLIETYLDKTPSKVQFGTQLVELMRSSLWVNFAWPSRP